MIAWSIEAAVESGCFDRVIVSTDDDEIASVARAWGAEVPFVRPANLSDDHIGTIPVVAHAVRWVSEKGKNVPTLACCLYATAPFIRSEDLRLGRQKLRDAEADYAFSVTSYAFPIQRAILITSKGRVTMLQPEHFTTRSQDLEEAWHDAAQFYWGRTAAWCEGTPMFSDAAVPVCLPRHRVQDIDTPEDWQRAEWLFRAMRDESDSTP